MAKREYSRDVLIDILKSYHRMIERSAKDYPAVVCDDIRASVESVLHECGETV